jgi:hypothetical protein
MPRLAVWALLFAAVPATAQVQLFLVSSTGETPVGSQLDLGSPYAGDIVNFRFRARNASPAAVTVQRLAVSGFGFTLINGPSLGYVLAPGAAFEFTVRFAPPAYGAYSANLAVNSVEVLLRATSPAAADASVEHAGRRTTLASGGSVDFDQLELGSAASRKIWLENPTTSTVTISSIAVAGDSFRLTDVPALPAVLRRGESINFLSEFAPATAGQHQGTLTIDGRRFSLRGIAVEPPFPRPAIVVEPAALSSGEQARVSVRLDTASRVSGEGRLRVDFRPAVAGPPDPAISFSNGASSANFSVARDASLTHFGEQAQLGLQTGTTAGTLVLTVTLGTHTQELTVPIAARGVSLKSARAARHSSGISVELTGFDNTRSASQISFVFYDADGRALSQGPIRADASSDFRRYFESSIAGGAFSLRAVFPVTGDAGLIRGVEVEMINSAGAARTERLSF